MLTVIYYNGYNEEIKQMEVQLDKGRRAVLSEGFEIPYESAYFEIVSTEEEAFTLVVEK